MPRKKKPAIELTTEEAMARLFPKRVVTALKKTIAETEESGQTKGKASTTRDDK